MKLKTEIEEKVKSIEQSEIWYDCAHGTYIMQFVLSDILQMCELTDNEKEEIEEQISKFKLCDHSFDTEIVIEYIETLETLFSEFLPDNFYLGYSNHYGDYGIFEYERVDLDD